ncbi:MAG: hypothetical protein JNL39_10260 [Opitutaceae bacterium]|nr:hypothetical protein [Opitutaceae bacterium]
MPAQSLSTEAFVLLKRPPSESFQGFVLFSSEHGVLQTQQRLAKKKTAKSPALDLFDEAGFTLESSNQGRTWFVKEVVLTTRHAGVGRSYEALRLASALGALVARNAVPEEGRRPVAALLRAAFAAFATGVRPDIVWFKGLYVFARDEGYPLKQQWLPTLPAADRTAVAALLNLPLAAQTAAPALVAQFTRRLEDYLRGETEILLD